jgi:hypothetical protein
MRPRAGVLLSAALLASMPGPARAQDADVGTVLVRATAYVADFVAAFSNVVAEERYSQERRPEGNGRREDRQLVSDLLFVRADGTENWLVFRDVRTLGLGFEPPEQGGRLIEILTDPGMSAAQRAEAVTVESARYTMPGWPTVNNPLLAIAFLQDEYRGRFDVSIDGGDDGQIVLRLDERARPTIVGMPGRDVPARARYWVDRDTGVVTRSEVAFGNDSRVTTRFGRSEALGIDVPVEMSEWYYDRAGRRELNGRAEYSNFRAFSIGVNTDISAP